MGGLHEHERSKYQWVTQDMFEKQVAEFFRVPQKLVMGDETAEQAYSRFTAAVERVVEKYPGKNVAIISHGTVITLYITRLFRFKAFPFGNVLGFHPT